MEQLSKLSTPVKLVAGVGVVAIVALLALQLFKPHSHPAAAVDSTPPARAVQHAPAPRHAKAKAKAKPAPQLHLVPGLPPALRVALRTHRVVVAVLAGGGSGGAVSTARAGAKQAHAGFAVLNVGNETVARDVATLVPGVDASSVLVVRRPGTIAVALPGYSDSDTVAQAVLETHP